MTSALTDDDACHRTRDGVGARWPLGGLACAALCVFAVACHGAPAPSPTSAPIPETDLDDEHLRAFVPPDWPVGRTWAIEGVVGYDSETALEEQGTFNTWWRGEIELRVVDNDGEQATIEAAVRREVSNHVPASWRLTYSLEPFFVVAAHTEGITRGVETREYRSVPGEYDEDWTNPFLIPGPLSPGSPAYLRPMAREPIIPERSFDERGMWTTSPTASHWGGRDRLTRRTLWRAGDPWFAITEALDQQGRPSQERGVPPRLRLVEVDGQRIEPVPWSEGHRR